MLGPNGAGKTTLISIICGIVNKSAGHVSVLGHDNIEDYRFARQSIGLVPQELTTDAFETVWDTVRFSRKLFGKPKNDSYLEDLLNTLSLWDKKDTELRALSGGMKRRVMIAKALSHEPTILFLDEPSAGVDVELRKSMWRQVRKLRDTGVTVILTTHYIEEAEDMADRIAVIRKGKLIVTEDKQTLMKTLGKKECVLHLEDDMTSIPKSLSKFDVTLEPDKRTLVLLYDPSKDTLGVVQLLKALQDADIRVNDIDTQKSSLEDIFVKLVEEET